MEEEAEEEAGEEKEEEEEDAGERRLREMSVVIGRRGDRSLHSARSESEGWRGVREEEEEEGAAACTAACTLGGVCSL